MDISQAIAQLKTAPGFTEQVGMILIHNGVVRAWSRQNKNPVSQLEVKVDYPKIAQLVKQFEQRPGIFKIIVEAKEGLFKPGDDLLFIVVAGDIREHVTSVLSELLEKIKTEAVIKKEFF
ncbi:MAG: molybdenum cofactor biosynthesis protein MoaE [Desulfonauticus sp.]|nr:molybdenum cofactor biosynthesis protein MoaE [Desulfonauticus sp.]